MARGVSNVRREKMNIPKVVEMFINRLHHMTAVTSLHL